MATANLQAAAAPANTDAPELGDTECFDNLYRRWRHARALVDVQIYDPARGGADVPDEILKPLVGAESTVLDALLKAPVGSDYNLATKLDVLAKEFSDSECSAEYLSAVARDAWTLVREARCG